MLKNYRLIGVCVSRITEDECAELLQQLFERTRGTEYRLLVFNSYMEYYAGNVQDRIERTVYDAIQFDMLDCLVVFDQCFANKAMVERLISEAFEHRVPVVVFENQYDGCFSVLPDYSTPYEALVRHVIETHGAKTLRYIGGQRGEYHSDLRLSLFRKVVEEKGLFFDPFTSVTYCDYWEGPVVLQIDKWVAAEDVPDALICANDVMAVAAVEQLKKHGYRVPQDVVVTGFDGLSYYDFYSPSLTTCKRNIPALADAAMDCIQKAMDGAVPFSSKIDYLLCEGLSCGCSDRFSDDDLRQKANQINIKLLENQIHEKQVFALFGNVLRGVGLNNLEKTLQIYLVEQSALCLSDGFLESFKTKGLPGIDNNLLNQMIITASNDEKLYGKINSSFPVSEMYPSIASVIGEERIILFQDIYAETELCGYYAIRTAKMSGIAELLHRIVNIMNGVLSLIVSRMRREFVDENITELRWRDGLTGLMNLKGLTSAVNERYDAIRDKHIALSVFVLPHYQFICENFSLGEADEAVRFIAGVLQKNNPEGSLIARTSNDKFVLINVGGDSAEVSAAFAACTAAITEALGKFNKGSDRGYVLEVNSGFTAVEPGWKNDVISLIKVADSEMYLNRLKQGSNIRPIQRKSAGEDFALLDLLIKNNMFMYHFQPIVSARTGEIVAYEALMRTGKDINLSPMEVLRIAQEHFRLYDIEYATLNNVMSFVEDHYSLFEGKRVFINSIPGCFLNDKDRESFVRRYSHLFHMCTIEITEQSEITDEKEVISIREMSDGKNFCQLAIDDYGTGFSNIVNLLRYSPNVIKIDRYLISDIQNDSNKQMFVKNTIDFARMNRIATLAEGVETYQEMKKVIELGVDYIQGYYTARPAPEVIQHIDSGISGQIIEENLKNVRLGNENRTYHAKNNETIRLLDLALKKYTTIEIHGGKIRIVGKKNHSIGMVVKIGEGAKCVLELENVNMLGPNETTIQLGFDAKCELVVIGDCTLHKEGISVPVTANLIISGDGNLDIQNTRNNGVAIGASNAGSFGNIIVDLNGRLNIFSSGDQIVCIGGGFGNENSSVRIVRGEITAEAKAISGVVIGSFDGCSNVRLEKEASVSIRCAGNQLVGIGTEKGTLNVLSEGSIRFYGEGDRIVGVGALAGGTGNVCLAGSLVDAEYKGANAIGVGSLIGGVKVTCRSDKMRMYGEGETTCGIGNLDGYGSVKIERGTIQVDLLSAEVVYVGGKNTEVIIDGGNLLIGYDTPLNAKNSLGQVLYPVHLREGAFSRHYGSEEAGYEYTAERDEKTGKLCVYLPV